MTPTPRDQLPPSGQPSLPADRLHAQMEAGQRRALLKFSQLIWLGFGLLEGLIGLRVVLKLMAANPQAPFAQWVYAATQPFLAPFVGLTLTPAAGGVVLEVYALVALLAYALLSILVERLIWIVFSRPRV
ncbi:MAG: YggT family protein [Anaerolineales bacterium]|nr:YggT family protein [Anaerolineales bacterium]